MSAGEKPHDIGEFRYRDTVIPDGIPAIVPKDLFDRVQERMAKNKKAPVRHKAEDDYILTTKLFCGHCGAYMCGESGKGRNGVVHHYYKCVSVKKRRTDCKKKTVKKDWIENLVIDATMDIVMNNKRVNDIVNTAMCIQDADNVNLPLYEKQLVETETAIENLLNAIQQGILTKSTKSRLEELEAAKEKLEVNIAAEKLAKPKLTEAQLRHWVTRFRVLDMRKKEHRQRLIDSFVNTIYLYDDKLVITFNYKEGSKTIALSDLHKSGVGSDLKSCTAPKFSESVHYTGFGELF